ncbi:Stage V sporulation protein D [bacterium HR35]|nr:Stage V sporulation protein D [bacterium HR35]
MNKRNKLNFLIYFYLIILFSLTSITLLELYKIQLVKANEIKSSFFNNLKYIPSLRGNIYLKTKNKELIPVAISYYAYDLYYNPQKAKNKEDEIKKIAELLNEKPEELLKKINGEKSVILSKNLEEKLKNKIAQLRFDSVFFEEKVIRSYPFKNLLSSIIGFAIYDEENKTTKGLYGLEKYYDEYLRGENGFVTTYGSFKPPTKGADIVLNIDYYIALKFDSILEEALVNFKAKGGLIIAMEADSGNIIGIAEKPDYDLNNYSKVNDYSIYLSRLSYPYEPGSVMKPFFYAGAFEEKILSPTSTYIDKGYVILNNKTIYNFDKKGRGETDLKTALVHSLNTGSVYVSQELGKTRFLKYVDKFRFNKRPEVDFPILVDNNLKTLYPPFGREVNFGTASFGQGISISPLSLLNAYQALFSNKITTINFASEIILDDGKKYENTSKTLVENIISPETSREIKEILEEVVENQAKKAQIKGYRIGGKTGSAQIPEKDGYSNDVITTFIGVFPLTNPKFIVLVRLDKPEPGLLAFGTAAPTFKKVAEFLINYYNIEPDKL